MPYSTHLDQNHFFMMEIVTWNILLSNGKTENSLLGVWFWGSVSHFRSQPFVTGSYVYCLSPVCVLGQFWRWWQWWLQKCRIWTQSPSSLLHPEHEVTDCSSDTPLRRLKTCRRQRHCVLQSHESTIPTPRKYLKTGWTATPTKRLPSWSGTVCWWGLRTER